MTKESYPETIKAAKDFKKLFDETIMADVRHGVNLTPFEEFVFNTGGKVSQLLDRFLSAYDNE